MNQFRKTTRLLVSAILFALVFAFAGHPAKAARNNDTNAWVLISNLAADDAVSRIAWTIVESNCETFIKKYPESQFLPDVMGVELRAIFKQGRFDSVIAKASVLQTNAVKAADQFAYWTARSYFEKGNYNAAAENFARLGREHPGSPLRLESIYRECEAYAKSAEWQRVVETLNETNGAFRQLARTNANDQWVVSGLLLLSDAQIWRKDFDAARKTLAGIAPQPMRPELEWERQFLSCRAQLAAGSPKDALSATTNLIAFASRNPEWKAKSIVLRGEIYERLGKLDEATRAYEGNLAGDLPPAQRREALIRIVELTLREEKPDAAAQKLADYLGKNPGEKGSDFEWLMLGELTLKRDYLNPQNPQPAGEGTNLLQQAEEYFGKVKAFTNSSYAGKAELNLGWCYAKEGKTNESLAAFSNAVEHLPFSEDQAVARFKFADSLFLQGSFAAAMTNYSEIIERYGSVPAVKNQLFEQTLYQLVRACVQQANPAADAIATNAVKKILGWFPDGMLADRSLLLYGQSQNPATARALFSDLEKRYPNSPLIPEVKLAIARTYEKEGNWPKALKQYDAWIAVHPTDPALPRAELSRAWATYHAGNETNAFQLFTNFVARFESNGVARTLDLPAQAQYWIGDYHWRQAEFQQAELSYEKIFQDWPESRLAFSAKMMAGRAAYQGQRPENATKYFSSLSADPNCPPGLKAQALFAFGDSAMQLPPTTNNAPFSNAIEVFYAIATGTNYSKSPIAARAWGRLGDCYFQMNGDAAALATTNAAAREVALQRYERASEYFQNAMESDPADVTTRSMAAIRLGQTFAAMAQLRTDEREELNREALDLFWGVFYETNLREGEHGDPSCIKEAGLEAGKLAGEMGLWKQARQIYEKVGKLMPPLQSVIEKKIAYAEAQESASAEKK